MSLANKYPDEEVLCVPTKHLYYELGRWRGLKMPTPDVWQTVAKHSIFKPREVVESDSCFKQLISYTFFLSQNKIFVMKRLSTQSEDRLHDLLSVGVGGHVNPVDDISWPNKRSVADVKAIVGLNTIREIREEVIFAGNPSLSVIGFINDDGNDVGKVHLGVVSVVQLNSPILAVKESDKMLGGWVDLTKIGNLDSFESWSSLILEKVI